MRARTIKAGASALGLGLGSLGAPAVAAGPPNILQIIADDLGVANVGAYTTGFNAVPGDPPPTPNIDALASSGVLFRNAWVAPVCSPTRACLFTGRYGLRTGVRNTVGPDGGLSLDEWVLPEVLSNAQYTNGLFGKWHLGGAEQFGGFDAPRTAGWDHHAGSLWRSLNDYYTWDKTVDGVTTTVNNYATTENVDDALAWVATQPGPWSCTVAFNAAHSPYHDPPEGLHTYDLSDADTNLRYKAMIQAMDTEIGRLLDGISSTADRTVIIFIGDNGTPEEVTEPPYTSSKGEIYEGGIHVPLIISGFDIIIDTPGREVLGPVAGVDLFATIADFAGVDVGGGSVTIDGVSLRPILTDASAPHPRQYVYAERVIDDPRNGQFAVRNLRYKLIQQEGAFELYDLRIDPFETRDLLLKPGGLSDPELAAYNALRAELDALRADLCSADLSQDGIVNLADIAILASHYGEGPEPPAAAGDLDGDGDVDLADLSVLLSEFGQTCW